MLAILHDDRRAHAAQHCARCNTVRLPGGKNSFIALFEILHRPMTRDRTAGRLSVKEHRFVWIHMAMVCCLLSHHAPYYNIATLKSFQSPSHFGNFGDSLLEQGR